MARKSVKVLLGFEDDCISEKQREFLNYCTDKIGGKPDWPDESVPHPSCKLCGISLPMILQIYAPLENSPYHRTLFIFGCINPNCWNHSESWICIRGQWLEPNFDIDSVTPKSNTSDWCCGADDWGEDNNNEENGNNVRNWTGDEGAALNVAMGNLSVDQQNANWGGGGEATGAVGRLHSPLATAEIEGDESEVVSIDTPTAPQRDIVSLLQEVSQVPAEFHGRHTIPLFTASFISVSEEDVSSTSVTPISEHVRDLMQEYQQNNEDEACCFELADSDQITSEKYEKSLPVHGDKMFHQFLSRIQQNPGHILRYCRDNCAILPLYPLQDIPVRCQHCQGEMVFELQILPTLIPKLHLMASTGVHLEFGSVFVYTCRKSCWAINDSWREERILVQSELL